jgi:hypothetical protein
VTQVIATSFDENKKKHINIRQAEELSDLANNSSGDNTTEQQHHHHLYHHHHHKQYK